MQFQNKVIVVTGAGGGVGEQLVLQLLEKGASVAAVDINLEALEKTKNKTHEPERVSIHQTDITDKKGVSTLAKEVKHIHGHIDGLINNAGIIQDFITIFDLNDSTVDRLMNINFYGMLNMTRAFIPYLAEQPEAFIGNVSSMGGFLPVPGQAMYGASKAAVKIATEGLRLELSKTNIQVSLIIPGGIETDIKKNSGLKNSEIKEEDKKTAGIKLTSPYKASEIIIKGIGKSKAKILVGSDCKVMDFLYRFMPIRAGKIISKVMSKNHGGIFSDTDKLVKR
ncbi:SDR family NAD(P)-dependent oxidoreductase [Sediminispirochaeta smaragdinae]|uniref:Short-chain dehydrogenase/reductase SDR n=1 Tax=Sediminispirochaeta smaragdinae (strain DSM 11293 / JCM 15392 / SEBR 4228) TaxID=573413 RepID=E1R2B9_SEDSS|nr:SDR family oxidoreductase [Sediminispirochaeta smaragdinae]ADK82479.1 short-chain dehydrogenase/reductase SDR [Sediminispirochaeta smaragdinae DSM 11293]